jgi:hypothetical protein
MKKLLALLMLAASVALPAGIAHADYGPGYCHDNGSYEQGYYHNDRDCDSYDNNYHHHSRCW